MKCLICKETGGKGFYQLKKTWLSVLNLPPDFELKKSHYICFRHFKQADFYFVGNQVRLNPGKINHK